MRLKPVLTEKSLKEAKDGKYSFNVPVSVTKFQIGKLIEDTFGVSVKRVRISKKGPELKRSYSRKNPTFKLAQKKAVVTLNGKDKIELFEELSE